MLNRIEVVGQVLECTACELASGYGGPVFMEGRSRVAILGESLTLEADVVGRPFAGKSRELLERLLTGAGLEPADLAWVNAVSCATAGPPSLEHLQACAPNVVVQLDYSGAEFVLVLGRQNLQAMRSDLDMAFGRARPFMVGGRVFFSTYHPLTALQRRAAEVEMEADVGSFARLVDLGVERWVEAIPDTCAACSEFVVLFEESGIGWCQDHRPICDPSLGESLRLGSH